MSDTIENGCPVCNGTLRQIDVPRNLYRCDLCHELSQQLANGMVAPLNQLLERHALGDDRVRAAISAPVVNTVKSFLDVFESSHQILGVNLAEAKGGLHMVLAKLENRLDFALSKLTGLDMASDAIGEALSALREARDLASPMPGRNRGIPQKDNDAASAE